MKENYVLGFIIMLVVSLISSMLISYLASLTGLIGYDKVYLFSYPFIFICLLYLVLGEENGIGNALTLAGLIIAFKENPDKSFFPIIDMGNNLEIYYDYVIYGAVSAAIVALILHYTVFKKP